MKKLKALLLIVPLFTLLGCNKSGVVLKGYTKEAQIAIKEFVKTYAHQDNAYIVTDFDNTTSIFDITYQCSVYQIETMASAVNKEELETALLTGLENDEIVDNYVDDITI